VQSNGSPVPSWLTYSTTEGVIRALSYDNLDAGTYQILITSRLANLQIFGADNMDPALKINPLNPPPNFIYQASFLLTIQVNAPLFVYVPTLVQPWFVPVPTDFWIYAGDSY